MSDGGTRAAWLIGAATILGPIVGVVAMMVLTSTEVEGMLVTGPELEDRTFDPDDCTAGSIHGFGGVQLTDSTQPDLRVRVLEDELGQMKLAWIREGAEPEVFDKLRCEKFSAAVEFTNTTVNDVRTMRGTARLVCDELYGELIFDGCGP